MHTKGKWKVIFQNSKAYGVRVTAGYLCFMREVSRWGDQKERYKRELKENEANAKLIAAAPDLLEACKDARRMYDELALSPLEAAAKYGDGYEPLTKDDLLRIRDELEQAIAATKKNRL